MSVVNHMRRIDSITNHIEKLRIRLLISSEKRDRNLLVNMMEKHRNLARPLTPLQPISSYEAYECKCDWSEVPISSNTCPQNHHIQIVMVPILLVLGICTLQRKCKSIQIRKKQRCSLFCLFSQSGSIRGRWPRYNALLPFAIQLP